MRFFRFGALSLSLSMLVAVTLALTGCGGGSDKDKDKTTGDNKPKDTGGTSTEKKALMAGKGSLKGTIKLDKSVEVTNLMKKAQEQHDTVMLQKDAEKVKHDCVIDVPKDHKADTEQQKWIVGADNGLANVFVWLEPEAGTDFAVDDKNPEVQKVKGKVITLDQPYCAYEPHAFILFPSYATSKDGKWKRVNTDEKLLVKSSAKFAHNTNVSGGGMTYNTTATEKGATLEPVAKSSKGEPVDIHCDIHKQMKAYALVIGNPYFALTDKDGKYEIKGVPAAKVKLKVWHEGAEWLTSEKGDDIELTDKETTKDFDSVKAK